MKTTKIRITGFILALAMLTSLLPLTIFASEDLYETVAELKCGVPLTETVENVYNGETFFKFVPEENGEYVIYSISDSDPCATLYDSVGEAIASGDDDNGMNFFFIYQNFVAGESYYLSVSDYSGPAECTVVVSRGCEGAHVDEDLDHKCDVCYTIFTGDYTINLDELLSIPYSEDGMIIKFVAEYDAKYHLYSIDGIVNDPNVSIYDDKGELVASNDDDDVNGTLNFSAFFEATANSTYFMLINQAYEGTETSVMLNLSCKHSSSSNATCVGSICNVCGSSFGLAIPNAHASNNTQTCRGYQCLYCYDFFGEANPDAHYYYSSNQTCKGYYCFNCEIFFGEANPDAHEYYDGVCISCEEEHDPHSWLSGECMICYAAHEDHNIVNNICSECGYCETDVIVINGKNVSAYSTIEEAVANAPENSTVKILNDLTLESSIEFNTAINFDLNGFYVDCNESSVKMIVNAGVKFFNNHNDIGVLSVDVLIYNENVKFIGGLYSCISVEIEGVDIQSLCGECSYLATAPVNEFIEIDLTGETKAHSVRAVETEHNFGDWNTINAATETVVGINERACVDCGKVEREFLPVVEVDDTPEVDTPEVDTPEVDTPEVDTPEVDTPDEDTNEDCDHMCHASGVRAIIWRIINFIYKIFGIDSVCDCGKSH